MPQTRQKKHQLYSLNFKHHVKSFIDSHGLIQAGRKIAISVSGGVDSLVLADVFASFGIPFELIHFNHGTRPSENLKEEELVREFGARLGMKLNIIHFNFSLEEKNFEKTARDARQKVYKDYIHKGYRVYTAHHIDDSYEWSLMQASRQSSVKSALGIPVINNGMIRPFMCVTKKQILRYARARKLSWIEDASNQNDKFERNYLRLHVTKNLNTRYPKLLAHYVSRSNQLALMQNVHTHSSQSKAVVTVEESGAILIVSKNFGEHKDEIKKCIYKLSNVSRGEIDHELDKLISSSNEMQKDPASLPFKGPMNFSGGVSIYLLKDHLFITNQKQRDFYKEFDHQLKAYLENKSQIPASAKMNAFPQLMISFRKSLIKSSKFTHPLLPVTCLWLKKQGISYAFAPLMSSFDRQLLANDAVILDSSVMGL